MAAGLTGRVERRRTARVQAHETSLSAKARLRHGQEVEVINVSHGGALVESTNAMRPGARTELLFLGPTPRHVQGRVARCRISALAPLRFEGAIAFDERVQWDG